MKAAIVLLVLAVGVLCSFAYSQNAALQQQQREVKQLQARLDTIPKTANIELREKCARQAREEFKLYGWDKESMADVVNHYDTKLDKCFMMVRSTDAKSTSISFNTLRRGLGELKARFQLSGNATYRDLAPWSDDKSRVADRRQLQNDQTVGIVPPSMT
jgi:hypothetical protein